MDFSFAPVMGITVICYLLALGIKALKLDPKWLPLFCGLLGGVLGIVAMATMPDFPASDVLNAAALGVVSGLAATGAHQVHKQLDGGGA